MTQIHPEIRPAIGPGTHGRSYGGALRRSAPAASPGPAAVGTPGTSSIPPTDPSAPRPRPPAVEGVCPRMAIATRAELLAWAKT